MKTIKKFQTIPQQVEAIQFKGDDNKYHVCELMKGTPFQASFDYAPSGKMNKMTITTAEYHIPLEIGSWLIKESDGSHSYINDEGFKTKFTEVK